MMFLQLIAIENTSTDAVHWPTVSSVCVRDAAGACDAHSVCVTTERRCIQRLYEVCVSEDPLVIYWNCDIVYY